MALPATENFNGSGDGTQLTSHSSDWTLNDGDFDIQSNAVAVDDPGHDEAGAHWNADSFNDDQYAEGDITNTASGVYVGVAVRCNTGGSANYYGYYSDSGDASYLHKNINGSWTQLGSTGNTFSTNDTVRIEAEGTTITPNINGSTTGTPGAQTDSALSSGSAGISGYDDGEGMRLDNWEGGNIGGPAGRTTYNTDSNPLGVHSGMAFRVNVP